MLVLLVDDKAGPQFLSLGESARAEVVEKEKRAPVGETFTS